jgi:hypothetical protein
MGGSVMSLIEGIGAVGRGLSKEVPNLLAAARDQRNENERQRAIQSPENQYKQAVSAQALEDLKKGQEKFAIADIEKMHPLAPAMIENAKAKMEIMPGQTHVELREIKLGMKAKLLDDQFMETALKGLMSQKTNEVKNAETSLGVEQEKLKKLQEDPLGNKVKIEETQKKIQNYTQVLGQSKQQESGLDAQLDKIYLRKAQKDRDKLKGGDALAWDAVLEKNKADGKVGKNAIPTAQQVEQHKQGNKYQEQTTSTKEFLLKRPEWKGKEGTTEFGKAYETYTIEEDKLKAKSMQGRYPALTQAQGMPPGYMVDRANGGIVDPDRKTVSGEDAKKIALNYQGNKKEVLTAKSPTFVRMARNAEILIEGVKDQKTGKMTEPELDKLVRLRNQVDDGLLGKLNSDIRAFNSWDQYVKYQVSDPKMAQLKSAVIANAERIGNMYSGGGTVTSDKKIELAKELLDQKLGKPGFKALIDMHKDSMRSTMLKYKETGQEENIAFPKTGTSSNPFDN